MTRSGIRIVEVFDPRVFEEKLMRLASGFKKRYGDLLEYDVKTELKKFEDYRLKLKPFVIDQVPLLQKAKAKKSNILIEGANALLLDIGLLHQEIIR